MIVEISLLPIMVQQAIMQGEQINFVNQGKIVTSTIGNQMDNNQTLYEWAMAYDGADMADIEFDEVVISKYENSKFINRHQKYQ